MIYDRNNYIKSQHVETQEKLLQSILEKEERLVFFDIGACEGESSIRYARLFPNAEIYTFEPLPANFNFIQQNITSYHVKNVKPYSVCLSDTVGETNFYVSSGVPEDVSAQDWDFGNKSSSLLAPAETKNVHSWLKFENEVKVQTTTLKQFCIENKINKIDFIHMDVQGAELMVLKGAEDFIHAINMIWLEVEAVELYKGQPLEKDIESFMLQHDFVKIEDTVYTTAGDQFWARKEYIIQKKGVFFVMQRQVFTTIKKYYKKTRRKILS